MPNLKLVAFARKQLLLLIVLACSRIESNSGVAAAATAENSTSSNTSAPDLISTIHITIPLDTTTGTVAQNVSQPAGKILTAKVRRIWHSAAADGAEEELSRRSNKNDVGDEVLTVWSPVSDSPSLRGRQQLDNSGFSGPSEEVVDQLDLNSGIEPVDRQTPFRFATSPASSSRRRVSAGQKVISRPHPPAPARPRPTRKSPVAYADMSTTNISDQDLVLKLHWIKKAGLLSLLFPGPQIDMECNCPPVNCNCGNSTSGGESVSRNMIVCLCNCNGTALQTSPVRGAVTARSNCPLDFIADSTGLRPSACFHMSALKTSWTDANLECEKMGAKLVEPRTAIDLRKTINLNLSRQSLSPFTDRQYWIGALQLMVGGTTVPVYKSDMQELPNVISQQISQKRATPLNRCLGLVECNDHMDGAGQCEKGISGYVLAAMPCQQDNLFVCELNPV